jgi:penicillin V acylase-like amidase (Ntn superfamily)
MRKIIVLSLMACLCHLPVFPCTTFVLRTKQGSFFGRNLDWVSDHGLIIVNQRNASKLSFAITPEKPIEWISKYGSISFNQFGKEFPYGGINEKGLVVEVMRSEADYAEFDERPIVNELQWVQYQLDNCATIDEVIATDLILRIGQAHEGLHYLVCDANGNSVVIEFLNGKMVAYKGNELPVSVLENETYKNSMQSFKNAQSCRFTTTANLIKKYNGGDPVNYSFGILDKVALTAEWSVVYDIDKMQIHFRTTSNNNIRMVDMNSFDFDCNTKTLNYSLTEAGKGNITQLFTKLNLAKNTEVLKKALEINTITLDEKDREQLIDYFKEIICRI